MPKISKVIALFGGKRWETNVEWTQEREDFCRKMYEAFASLIDMMKEKFKDEKHFNELIIGKVKLLN